MNSKSPRKRAAKAEELTEELEADPEWVARRDQKERERQRIVEKNLRDAAPIIEDLARGGFHVKWVADLYNRRMNYEAAIPILLDWFPRIDNPDVKEDVARALTVSWARPQAAPLMLSELRELRDSETHRSLRFAIANALTQVGDDSVFDDLVELVRDARYGWEERGVLAHALANTRERREQAIKVLRELLSSDEEAIAINAMIALGELRATEARAEIEPFLEHEEGWVRQEAKEALRKLDTAERQRS